MPRPRLSDDAPKVLLVRAPPALVAGLDELVAEARRKRGVSSRADVVRELLAQAVKTHRRRRSKKG